MTGEGSGQMKHPVVFGRCLSPVLTFILFVDETTYDGGHPLGTNHHFGLPEVVPN